ncbi:hypothetical protein [Endozoicomonas acroporae]|uniref:hypothetical protein n=1 Tax=Endozoicomonas acroporae TaxID=1701104 RepID=UPI003D7B9422
MKQVRISQLRANLLGYLKKPNEANPNWDALQHDKLSKKGKNLSNWVISPSGK